MAIGEVQEHQKATARPSVRFAELEEPEASTSGWVYEDDEDLMPSGEAHGVLRDEQSWAGSMPAAQGLYSPEHEKDACGVGFVCHIKGEPSHKIVSDARSLLCVSADRWANAYRSQLQHDASRCDRCRCQRRRRCRCHGRHARLVLPSGASSR